MKISHVIVILLFLLSVVFLLSNNKSISGKVYALGGTGGLGEDCRSGSPRCDTGLVCTTDFGPGTCIDPASVECRGSGAACSIDGQCCSNSCVYVDEYSASGSCVGGGGGSTPPTSTPTPQPPTPTSIPTCAAPTYISGTDTDIVGAGTVDFTWTAVSGATQYRVQRQSGSSSWTTMQTSSSTTFSGADDSNDPNWRVYVYTSNGTCSTPGSNLTVDPGSTPNATPTPTATPTPAQCAAPVITSAADDNQAGGGTVSFAWNSVSGASQYTVMRATSTGGWTSQQTLSSTSYSGSDGSSDRRFRVYVSSSTGSCSVPGAITELDPGGAVPPGITNANIAPEPVNPNGSTQHTVTLTGIDANGGNDIGSMYSIINYQGPNAGQHRGYFGWSTIGSFPNFTGFKSGSPVSCLSGGGEGAINSDSVFNPEYVNIIACTTSVSGNTRTVILTLSFNTNYSSPSTNNTVSGWVRDWGGLQDAWEVFDTFSIIPPPTSTPTSTPTPTPASYTVSGTVFVDQDPPGGNGTQDGIDLGYSGATIELLASGTNTVLSTATSIANGTYTLNNVLSGLYDIRIILPARYTNSTSNPRSVVVASANVANVHFGLVPQAPLCLTPAASFKSGESGSVTLSGCEPSVPNPTIIWENPIFATPTPGGPTPTPGESPACGSVSGSGPSITYNAPNNVCTNYTCSIPFSVSNSSGTTNQSVDVGLSPNNTLTGEVLIDSQVNSCVSGADSYQGAVVTINNGTSPAPSDSSDINGSYSINDGAFCSVNRTAVLSNLPAGFKVKAVDYDGSGWNEADPNLSGFSYGFNFDNNTTKELKWCVTDSSAWTQIDGGGNVRSGSRIGSIPAGQSIATGGQSIIVSSGSEVSLGEGSPGTGFLIDNEYNVNSDPRTRNGVFSHTFFESRARTQNINIISLPNQDLASNFSCDNQGCDINGLPTGIYRYNNSQDPENAKNLTIKSYTHSITDDQHVTILADNITISNNIIVPQGRGHLLILAAKNNITVDPSVGVEVSTDTSFNIESILTAEEDIIIETGSCSIPGSVKRLNIHGSLIANSLKPFATGGTGKVENKRELCNNDKNPSLTVTYRPDFIPQLTDFYKVPLTRWTEVNP